MGAKTRGVSVDRMARMKEGQKEKYKGVNKKKSRSVENTRTMCAPGDQLANFVTVVPSLLCPLLFSSLCPRLTAALWRKDNVYQTHALKSLKNAHSLSHTHQPSTYNMQ